VEGEEVERREGKQRGKTLVHFIEEREWGILNRSIKGDEDGEYTFTGGREGR
jgi:hypothetical protein